MSFGILNNSEVTAKAYNEQADYCCSKLNKNNTFYIKGYLNSKMQIIVNDIEKH